MANVKITHKLLEKTRREFHRHVAQEYFTKSLIHLFGVLPIKKSNVLRQAEFEFTINPYSKQENELAAAIMGASASIFADIVKESDHSLGFMTEIFIPEISRLGDNILVKGVIEYQADK